MWSNIGLIYKGEGGGGCCQHHIIMMGRGRQNIILRYMG